MSVKLLENEVVDRENEMAKKTTKKTTKETTRIDKDEMFKENMGLFIAMLTEVSSIEGSKIAIIMHKSPDPDSMGSASGIQWMLRKKFGIDSDIFHEGEVSHYQNKTMVNILDIDLKLFEEYEENKDSYTKVIIVDVTTKNLPIKKADVVIDHHRVGEDSAEIKFIESLGSASTIVYEIIKSVEMEFEDDVDAVVATALLFGIKNDTDELTSETSTDRDFSASFALINFVDRKKLANIINYPFPAYMIEMERELNREDNHEKKDSIFVGGVGIISESRRDCLPILADKMLRFEGVETTVVFAIVGQTDIVASVRSQNPSVDVSAFCKGIFGPTAGGKLGSGGARIPLGSLLSIGDSPDDETSDEIWKVYRKMIFHKVNKVATGS